MNVALRVCAVSLLLLAACFGGLAVDTQYDRNAQFATFRTFDWLGEPPRDTGIPRLDDTAIHNRVRTAIEQQLAAKGYQRIFGGKPDFFVAYHLSLSSKLHTSTLNRRVGYPIGESWGPGPGGAPDVSEHEKGTLVLDIVDAHRNKLVFRGIAEKKLPDNPSPAKSRKNAREAVAEILKAFPPE